MIRSLICGSQQNQSNKTKKFRLKSNPSSISVVYFTGYDSADEELDLQFTVSSLVTYGVPVQNIYVFAPAGLRNSVTGVNFYQPWEYQVQVGAINCKYLLSYISGHGAHNGVGYFDSTGAQQIMKPYDVVRPYNSINGLELCLLFINQCYAGVFNYWDTFKPSHQLCIVGSTGMHTAIADAVAGNKVACNVFLYYLNLWMNYSDRDLDGDGEVNLLDMYKFASFETGKFFISFRNRMFKRVNSINQQLAGNPPAHTKIMLEKRLNSSLEFLHANQNPWILNANLARNVYF